MDFLKTLVKKNIITSILFDYIMSISGFNFEKEYKIVNLIKKNYLLLSILEPIEEKV